MRKLAVWLLAGVLALSGCSARAKGWWKQDGPTQQMNAMMASWVGVQYSALIMNWGPPNQVFDDGLGGKLLAWTQARSVTFPGTSTSETTANATAIGNTAWGRASSRGVYNPPEIYTWSTYRIFQVDKDGIVRNWAWRGL